MQPLERGLRQFRRHLISCFALLILPAAMAADERPNFIFIITDDQRWDAMGVVQKEQGERARFPWFQTPNMDRIAAQGVRFRNAFVTLSLCSPSRAAFLTGTYNHVNGVLDNSTPFPENNVTYASLMRDAGYATGFFGKFHHGTQKGPRPGFDYNASFIGQGVYRDCPFEVNGVMTPSKGWVEDVIIDHAIKFLKMERQKPFSMFIGFKTPHEPTQPPVRAEKRFSDETARVVPNLTIPAVFRVSPKDATRKSLAEAAIREGEGVKVKLNWFRCLSAVDDGLGKLLDVLDDLKLSDNTVLVFTSDNGYYLGEHCLGDKRSAYEESLRIPMLFRYPKRFPQGAVRDEMVLNTDLAPTFLELAGIPVPAHMQGRSMVPLLTGKETEWRKSFLAEYFIEREYPNTPTFLAVRTTHAKLVKYPGHEEWTELFDLSKDPYETRNLVRDPAHAPLLAELNAEMERLSKELAYQ
ncbi:MAG: sulfatase family protein, partial [Luteolibacter sp.]